MSPCKITSAILPLALLAAFAAPATAGYIERSTRAVAAAPPLPVAQAPDRNMAGDLCSRYPDDVLVNPATGLRNCEAASMAGYGDGRQWWGGLPPMAGASPSPDMSPDACWRHPYDVLVNPATGRRTCAE